MPELPEVETTINLLRKKVLGRTFLSVWTDAEKLVKKPENWTRFETEIKGLEIKEIKRRAKYILFEFVQDKIMLAHQKMTGHFLVGAWEWDSLHDFPKEEKSVEGIEDPFIHLAFKLDNGQTLALSDMRKFARIELWEKEEFEKKGVLHDLGPEPLASAFTFDSFEALFKGRRARIKSLLMNQKFISGIGNIYSDEILWRAGVNPFKKADQLQEEELKKIYDNMKKVLKRAIEKKGTSTADYRTPEGRKGRFGSLLKAYGREGERCPRCGKKIVRKKIGSRSTHYCLFCQP